MRVYKVCGGYRGAIKIAGRWQAFACWHCLVGDYGHEQLDRQAATPGALDAYKSRHNELPCYGAAHHHKLFGTT